MKVAAIVVDEEIKHADFSRSQREGWRRILGGTVEKKTC